MPNNKFVVITQQDDKVTLSRFIGKQNDGIMSFAFSELESGEANRSLVEDYRKYGDAIFIDDTEPSAA
jgi:hypothetical protein